MVLLLAARVQATEPMTNETIIKMVQSGVPTETIIKTIQSADSFRFGTLPGDLMQLQQAKVPDEVIRALAARINWVGPSPVAIVPLPPGTLQAPPKTNAKNGYVSQNAHDNEDPYLFKGAKEIEFLGSGFPSHSSSSNTLNLAGIMAGRFVSQGNMVGAGVMTSGLHDIFVSGLYRYFIKTHDSKVYPFAGAGAGFNVAQTAASATSPNYLATAQVGLRYFAVRQIAIDMAYNLQYVHTSNANFGQSTSSGISVGFIHVF